MPLGAEPKLWGIGNLRNMREEYSGVYESLILRSWRLHT